MLVPNEQPKYTSTYRLAIIGEAPGADEDSCGRPFMGYSGQLLWGMASAHGITRDACLVGNVCQHRPPNNEIKLLKWDGPEIQEGQAALLADLATAKPNLVLLLGNTALRAAKGHYLPDIDDTDEDDADDELVLSDEENRSSKKEAILAWRGSLFMGFSGQYKCLASVHPAAVLRQYALKPLLNFDLKRAKEEAQSPHLILPERNLRVDLTPADIIVELEGVLRDKPTIAIDIEGDVSWMSCMSIARSPTDCFIVPFDPPFWADLYDAMWRLMLRILTDPTVPKILQNALYDLFVLRHAYGITVRGVVDDTMLAHWELYCELKKGLGTQASIYTREPYWKSERTAPDRHTFHTYCCKDSAVTYEIRDKVLPRLSGRSLDHYRFNLSLLDPILYMECNGIRYDRSKAKLRFAELSGVAHRLQWAMNEIIYQRTPTREEWFTICKNAFCQRRLIDACVAPSDLAATARSAQLDAAIRAGELLSHSALSLADHGELATLASDSSIPADQRGPNLNVRSTQDIQNLLYVKLQLPVQYKKERGKKTDRPTTDVLALLTLYKKTSDSMLRLILSVRALRKRCEALAARTDRDGRIRCGYNVVGTKTGRISCYSSPTGSGFNLQTVTKKDRDLFLPDPGYWMFQCDLSGADSWTVAAHCAALGDRTMLDDLLAGLKVAKILCVLNQHGRSALSWNRDQLRVACKAVDSDDWRYFTRKMVTHGSSYGMKPRTMSDNILRISYKIYGHAIYLSPDECEEEQRWFFARYPGVRAWHDHTATIIKKHGYLTSANGHKRVFFGRREDHETLKEALADEPQNNTTYATNLALHKLWTDPENRDDKQAACSREATQRQRGGLRLRIQPLHQVHDALVGQFRQEDTEWAIGKIRSYFSSPLRIAGSELIIPFEGGYGPNWKDLSVGSI